MITMSSFKYAGLIISIIISLISCTHNKNYPTAFQPELAKAEAMMYRYPDSALHILQGIQPDIPSENEQYATWALLMTQAQYKNQIEQSDSLINIAYSYFTKHDNAQRKALALYYKGILRHESHHAEDALSFYLEAATEIEKTNDYQLGFLINSEVGLMYLYRKLNDYAMEYFEKAHHNAELSDNQTYIAFSFIYIARAFSQKKQYNKAIEYYEKAIKIIIRKTKCFDFWERNVLFPKTKRSFFRTPTPLPCPFPLNFSLLIITKKFGNLAKNRYICIV